MKHLGSAAIFEMETAQGYPDFAIYVIGSLDHASTEIHKLHPEFAMLIRQHRINWMENHNYDIPYEELHAYLACLEHTDKVPDIPPECKAGITSLVTDTRP